MNRPNFASRHYAIRDAAAASETNGVSGGSADEILETAGKTEANAMRMAIGFIYSFLER